MGTPQRSLYVLRCSPALKDERAHWKGVFFDLLATLPLINAGLLHGQLAMCFVLPLEDSLASVFQAVKDRALIHQFGGSTCFGYKGCVGSKRFSG